MVLTLISTAGGTTLPSWSPQIDTSMSIWPIVGLIILAVGAVKNKRHFKMELIERQRIEVVEP